jgi:hypothetical protein
VKNISRYIANIVLILSLSSALHAEGALTSGFEFLNTDYNARSAAMGRAFLTMRGDVSGMFVNPAGMAYTESKQVSIAYTNYLLDVNAGYTAYAHVLPKFGILSVGLIYMNYGSFTKTDENAVETGTFSAGDMAIAVGLANHIGKGFSYGVNLKYIYSNIEQFSAHAIALDFSLLYEASFQEDLYFVVTMQNLGSNISSYGEVTEPMPTNLGLGFSKRLAHLPLEIAFSFNDLNASTDNFGDHFKGFSVGGEFRLSKMLRFRLGYNNSLHRGLDVTNDVKFSGVSAGFGLLWRTFRFDYAYSNIGLLGATHRFGFKVDIN